MLTLARVEPEAELPRERVQVRALLGEVLAETAHLAAERQLAIDFEEGPAVEVKANAEALAILLRNLLVNAFRYALEGSVVSLRLRALAGSVLLEVRYSKLPMLAELNPLPILPALAFLRVLFRELRSIPKTQMKFL